MSEIIQTPADSITQIELAGDSVGTAEIIDGDVAEIDLGADSVTAAKIKDGEVKEGELATDAVTAAKIKDGEVKEAELATDAVTAAKIKDGEVKADELATDAVVTAKLKDANVTLAKLPDQTQGTALGRGAASGTGPPEVLDDTALRLIVGGDEPLPVRKGSAGTIARGCPVYAAGWNVSGFLQVEEADASDPAKMPAFNIATEAITNSATVGLPAGTHVISSFNTNAWSDGDALYVAAAGGLTNVKPTGTNLVQSVGVVLRKNVTVGSFAVFGAGRPNDLPNIPSTQVWQGNVSGVPTATARATMVGGAGAVMDTDFTGAQSVMVAVTADTPTNVALNTNEVVGRRAGSIGGLAAFDIRRLIGYEWAICHAVIAVADAGAGATIAALTLDLQSVGGNNLQQVGTCVIYASDTQYAGPNDPNANITLDTVTEGSILASDAAAGWWLVKTDGSGNFNCNANNINDEQVWFNAADAPGGVDAVAEGCLIRGCIPDSATWS